MLNELKSKLHKKIYINIYTRICI